jgi:hypothetical protein
MFSNILYISNNIFCFNDDTNLIKYDLSNNTYVTKYIPYFNELPLVLFVIKVILMGLLYHIIRYFMN